ncbi:DMT family transporter [Aliterella atlantica]|uniref:Small multidrug resistance protein n=1 Tax=Aliterella atlantica CENA595 TaxID=1618023 RepID=A0A0D8ZTL0_9CYAN|nr:SMR family transporter [Aliterella atlantica]KJH71697.1 hypothetical protein UH38_11660 [Aliterella atlantica CENA595]
MYSLLVLIAAVAFTVGGIYMKLSAGLTELVPSLLVYICFAVGASLQALAMRQSDLGVTYLVVLGLESVLAFFFSTFLFQEASSMSKYCGVSLLVAGMILLHLKN